MLTTTRGPGWIKLSWEPVPGADMYDVWRRIGADGAWQRTYQSPFTQTTYDFIGYGDGTVLHLLVRAIAADGKLSPWSELAQETAIGRRTPTPTPTGPTPTSTATGALPAPVLIAREAGTNAIELNWAEVAGADRYELMTWWAEDPGWQGVGGSLRGTSYTHRGLTPGRTYYYAIRAIDANGVEGAWTDKPYPHATVPEPSTHTPTPTPTPAGPTPTPTPTPASAGPTPTLAPAGPTPTPTPTPTANETGTLPAPTLSATYAGATTIKLVWSEVPGADWYELWTWWDSDPGWQLVDDRLQGASYSHRGLTPGRAYHYAIRAINASGVEGAWTPEPYPSAIVPSTPQPDIAAERAALVALYNATGGPNWRHSGNWLSNQPLSTWYGVFTDSSGNVVRLHLSTNRLSGPLPDLSALTKLTTLDLSNNRLTGEITVLSSLTNLTALSLIGNQLSGPLPDLSTLTALTSVNLNGNELTGPIPNLETLTRLRFLFIRDNRLSGEIPELSALTRLQTLALSGNRLKGEIPNLSALTGLQVLALGLNRLEGEIPDLSALANLERLTLSGNQLEGMIPDLSALIRLEGLYLNDNKLTGEIPDLSGLPDLAALNLAGNDLCLPVGAKLSALHNDVAVHLKSIGLTYCGNENLPVAPTSPEEKGALAALFQATDGAGWTNRDNWLTDAPIATWYGVSTDGEGRVNGLRLPENNLAGQIPDLKVLTKLTTLDLGGNNLAGQIPDLSALTNLTALDLGANELTGSVPDLSALTNLTTLELSNNMLTGAISDLRAPASLVHLSLSSNRLRGQIPDLGAFTNLWRLEINDNNLDGPLPDLSALTTLTTLNLSDNRLTGSIQDLNAPANLGYLYLDANRISGRILAISALSNLVELTVSANKLTGEIPDLSALTSLKKLDLSSNQLEGAVPDLSALTNLTSLDLSGNDLCLPEDTDLTALSSTAADHLRSLNLSTCTGSETTDANSERAALVALYNATGGPNWTHNDNWLTDEPIAAWHGVLLDESGRVAHLILQKNGLNGGIPDLGALTNLTILDLNNNRLSGEIPDLGALSNLTILDLHANELSGTIPDLNALTELAALDLGHNNLTGSFPDLSALTKLWWLRLGNNRLTGEIPDLSTLTALNRLLLHDNRLTGKIPDLSALTSLAVLDLNNNQLTGQIPGLSTLTALEGLRLHDNRLTGKIPDLSALTSLVSLYLNNNQLTGQIPGLSTLTALEGLRLHNNRLTGNIPDLSALTELRSLDLSDNQLSESIPNLSALSRLKDLHLDSNRLTGQFPDLSTLTDLTKLYLNDNNLSGPILGLNLLTKLTRLYLHDNRLTGPFPDLTALAGLNRLNLSGNRLCRPAGSDLAGANSVVTAHLNSLNLAACTDAELAAVPGTPQELAATVAGDRVTLAWNAVTAAVSYDLRAWDSFDRLWGPVGGVITGATTYTHTVRTDGRNYYYQVRARDAGGTHGAWTEQLYVAVVSTQFPPPPQSLGFEMYFQKYMDVSGIVVVAPSIVPDEQMIRSREVITGLLANRADLLQDMAVNNVRIFIRERFDGTASASRAYIPVYDPHCDTFIHEVAHLIDFAIDRQSNGAQFNDRLRALYLAAFNNGLWPGEYALTNAEEYWAETVKYWVWEYMPPALAAAYPTVKDHDPEVVKLIEETLGDVTVPAACKP